VSPVEAVLLMIFEATTTQFSLTISEPSRAMRVVMSRSHKLITLA
jgi:hypothetical protein